MVSTPKYQQHQKLLDSTSRPPCPSPHALWPRWESRPGPPGEAKEDSRVTMGPHTPHPGQGQIADAQEYCRYRCGPQCCIVR